jgi:hypothetical protein
MDLRDLRAFVAKSVREFGKGIREGDGLQAVPFLVRLKPDTTLNQK